MSITQVVKLIGDEVMFAATDPSAACEAAIALMDAFLADYVGVAPRGGVTTQQAPSKRSADACTAPRRWLPAIG